MKVRVHDRERYAMKALEADEQRHVGEGGLDIYAMGEALGLSREESQDCVDWMREKGWGLPDYRMTPPRLTLTQHGREEIAKLKWPRWRRLLNNNPALVAAIVSAVISGGFLLLSILLRWRLGI